MQQRYYWLAQILFQRRLEEGQAVGSMRVDIILKISQMMIAVFGRMIFGRIDMKISQMIFRTISGRMIMKIR